MFKKLRNRLLLMNLSIISILMLISFSTIYFITSNNIHDAIQQDLFRVADINKNDKIVLPKIDVFGIQVVAPEFNKDEKDINSSDKFSQQRLTGFIIETDESFQMTSWLSFFSADDTFFEAALSAVKPEDRATGDFELDDSHWAYMVQKRPSGYVIAYVDMSTQKQVLDRLILTFIAVSVGMFILIFFISSFLTERSIKPIKESYYKQKQFISDASHELKTPLAVIHTNVDVLLTNTDEQNKKWLEYIKSEVERMGHLTNDLLYLTQMDGAEDHQMMKTTFNISERLEHILLGLEVVAFEKNISLIYDIAPDIEMHGNAEQVSQVMMILLDNAIKYTQTGGDISILLSKSTHHINLSVTNSGDGISEEDLPYVFDRFYRADKVRSRESGSYGLGLSIAKTIVEQHNGKITCESKVGDQTNFTVRFKL